MKTGSGHGMAASALGDDKWSEKDTHDLSLIHADGKSEVSFRAVLRNSVGIALFNRFKSAYPADMHSNARVLKGLLALAGDMAERAMDDMDETLEMFTDTNGNDTFVHDVSRRDDDSPVTKRLNALRAELRTAKAAYYQLKDDERHAKEGNPAQK